MASSGRRAAWHEPLTVCVKVKDAKKVKLLVDDAVENCYPEAMTAIWTEGQQDVCITVASSEWVAKMLKDGVPYEGQIYPVQMLEDPFDKVRMVGVHGGWSAVDIANMLAPYCHHIEEVCEMWILWGRRVQADVLIVRLEATHPLPNFVRHRGKLVRCKGRSIVEVCSHCGEPGTNGTGVR